MTPSGAYQAMLNLQAQTRLVKQLAKACNNDQKQARLKDGRFIPLSECEHWHEFRQAQDTRRMLRDQYGV